MTLPEVWEPLARWSAAGQRCGTATLVRVRRSAPRPPGARFAASESGELAGSVSSGCVEGDLHEHIRRALADGAPRLLSYGITDEMAAEVGLACGGEIDVLVAPHDPDDPAWREAGRIVAAGGAAVLLTGLSEGIRGRRLLLRPDGSALGSLGDGALDRRAVEAAARLLDAEGARVVGLADPGAPLRPGSPGRDEPAGRRGPGVGEEEAAEALAETFLPPPRLLLVGATPVAAALCTLASRLGFAVTVVDPREAFARDERFPGARAVVRAWPEEGLERAGLDRWTDVVALAHDRKLDVPALAAALRAGCRYVGQIGGARTQRLRREALAERGLGEPELARIRGPVGLDIGAVTPEEIALAILAEVVAVRRGRDPRAAG